MARTHRSLLAAALLAAAAATPAAALDLTGTWTGKFSCTFYDGTTSKFTQADDVMKISQTGDVFAVDSLNQFSGIAVASAAHPDTQGEAKLANCSTDQSVANGGDELARLSAKVNREKGTGTLKGTSIYTDTTGFGICKWSYKLTDPAPPNAVGCGS